MNSKRTLPRGFLYKGRKASPEKLTQCISQLQECPTPRLKYSAPTFSALTTLGEVFYLATSIIGYRYIDDIAPNWQYDQRRTQLAYIPPTCDSTEEHAFSKTAILPATHGPSGVLSLLVDAPDYSNANRTVTTVYGVAIPSVVKSIKSPFQLSKINAIGLMTTSSTKIPTSTTEEPDSNQAFHIESHIKPYGRSLLLPNGSLGDTGFASLMATYFTETRTAVLSLAHLALKTQEI